MKNYFADFPAALLHHSIFSIPKLEYQNEVYIAQLDMLFILLLFIHPPIDM